MSFEFILYAAASIVALAVGLGMASSAAPRISAAMNQAYTYGLLAEISSHMPYYNSTFVAYVPKSFCSYLSGGGATSDLGAAIAVQNWSMCSGNVESVDLEYHGGNYSIS
jgi:hypothetical protein